MASIASEPNGRRRIILRCPDGRRRPIRLGRVSLKVAEAVKGHVEHLLAAGLSGNALPLATAEWLSNVPASLRARLERAGLVGPAAAADAPTFADWSKRYIDVRPEDLKPLSVIGLEQVAADMRRFFGDRRLDEVTPGDAEELRAYMKGRGLAEATVRRRLRRAKQFFGAAFRKRLLPANPFADLKCGTFANPGRRRFVTVAEIEAVLARTRELAGSHEDAGGAAG